MKTANSFYQFDYKTGTIFGKIDEHGKEVIQYRVCGVDRLYPARTIAGAKRAITKDEKAI